MPRLQSGGVDSVPRVAAYAGQSAGGHNAMNDSTLHWDERERYADWYRRHAGSGYCAICEAPGPCTRWQEARDRLQAAGLLDEHGRLRPGAVRRGPK
jgi:hypothetical protein